jgi:hypothetical protein
MAVDVEIDAALLKCEIKKTYARVSEQPEEDFVFPTGRAWAVDLGYPADLLARVPDGAVESFAGWRTPSRSDVSLPASACSTWARGRAPTRSSLPRRSRPADP